LLQKQLHNVQLDRVLGTEMMVSADHPYQAVLMRDLKAQVESLKAQEAEPGDRGDRGQAVYEVYTRTEAAKFAHLSKVRPSRYGLFFLGWLINDGLVVPPLFNYPSPLSLLLCCIVWQHCSVTRRCHLQFCGWVWVFQWVIGNVL